MMITRKRIAGVRAEEGGADIPRTSRVPYKNLRGRAVPTRNLYPRGRLAEPMPEGNLERTLVLVKPDGVRRGKVGDILHRLERKGLRILAMKTLQVVPELAQRHYAEHEGKPFYPALMQHITSGPAVAIAIEGRSAVSVVRLIVGATNPQLAAPGTIRGDLALGITANLVHASDSTESAARELALYFEPEEYLAYSRMGEEYY